MFLPSENAVRHLCNALHALPEWYKLFEGYGLIESGKYPNYEYPNDPNAVNPDAPYPVATLWQDLKEEVDEAVKKNPEQLRALCSDLLRRKDELSEMALGPFQKRKFLDSLAEFEVLLQAEGYPFDGFQILDAKQAPSVAQIADKALSQALNAGALPGGEKVQYHLNKAIGYLNGEEYVECLTNLRLALKYILEGIAKELARKNSQALPFDKENEIRDYLEKVGFLSREEKNGINGIYGLLSAGPHGKANRKSALLGYAVCQMACHYVQEKFQVLTSDSLEAAQG